MIVSFSVANYRSFAGEQTLSLVASNRLSASHEDHAVPIPDSKERVLRAAVLYGANGAGKSNLFQALRYLKTLVLRPRERGSGTAREPFRLGNLSGEPSAFDLQFIVAGKLYRYGVKLDDERIVEEWLVQTVGGREKTLYERVTDSDGRVAIDASGIDGEGAKLRALATVGGPQNQTFLATVRATLERPDIGDPLLEIIDWFREGLRLVEPDQPFGPIGLFCANDPTLLEFGSEFLREASTGVDRLEMTQQQISEEELRAQLPASLVDKLLVDLSKEDGGVAVVERGGDEWHVTRHGTDRYRRVSIRASHRDLEQNPITFELSQESDGTRRLLNLIPALHQRLRSDAVYFIDEIDRSLHPELVRKFLEFFLKSEGGGPRQILATTHESNLLDLELLRRDEIWFAEKDPGGASHLYSLLDFKVRNDLEIRKHYLQGRFGAVPFLGNLDQLLAKEVPAG